MFFKGDICNHSLSFPGRITEAPKQKVTLICLSSLIEEVTDGIPAQISEFWSTALATTLITLPSCKPE